MEELVVPAGRVVGPGDLEACRERVRAGARAVAVRPAQALPLDGRGLGAWAELVAGVGAGGLAEGMSGGGQRYGLFQGHAHPGERLLDVGRGGERVGDAARTLRVDIDEAQL